MPSERIQAEIDRQAALESAEAALGLDPQNEDTKLLTEAAPNGRLALARRPHRHLPAAAMRSSDSLAKAVSSLSIWPTTRSSIAMSRSG